MALSPADLLAPVGAIEPTLFADDDPGGSTAARAYAEYRLWSAKAGRLAEEAAQVRLVDGSSWTVTAEQVRYWQERANAAWAVYVGLLTDAPAPSDPLAPRTREVGVRW